MWESSDYKNTQHATWVVNSMTGEVHAHTCAQTYIHKHTHSFEDFKDFKAQFILMITDLISNV